MFIRNLMAVCLAICLLASPSYAMAATPGFSSAGFSSAGFSSAGFSAAGFSAPGFSAFGLQRDGRQPGRDLGAAGSTKGKDSGKQDADTQDGATKDGGKNTKDNKDPDKLTDDDLAQVEREMQRKLDQIREEARRRRRQRDQQGGRGSQDGNGAGGFAAGNGFNGNGFGRDGGFLPGGRQGIGIDPRDQQGGAPNTGVEPGGFVPGNGRGGIAGNKGRDHIDPNLSNGMPGGAGGGRKGVAVDNGGFVEFDPNLGRVPGLNNQLDANPKRFMPGMGAGRGGVAVGGASAVEHAGGGFLAPSAFGDARPGESRPGPISKVAKVQARNRETFGGVAGHSVGTMPKIWQSPAGATSLDSEQGYSGGGTRYRIRFFVKLAVFLIFLGGGGLAIGKAAHSRSRQSLDSMRNRAARQKAPTWRGE